MYFWQQQLLLHFWYPKFQSALAGLGEFYLWFASKNIISEQVSLNNNKPLILTKKMKKRKTTHIFEMLMAAGKISQELYPKLTAACCRNSKLNWCLLYRNQAVAELLLSIRGHRHNNSVIKCQYLQLFASRSLKMFWLFFMPKLFSSYN